jgi:hypothetical protein
MQNILGKIQSSPFKSLRLLKMKIYQTKWFNNMCVNIFWKQNNNPSACSYLSAFPMSRSACSLDVPTHNGLHYHLCQSTITGLLLQPLNHLSVLLPQVPFTPDLHHR